MALSKQTLAFTASLKLIRDTDVDETAENDVNAGAGTLYGIKINNSLNSAASFVKLYNNAAPTVGTTAPDMVIKVKAGKTRSLLIPQGISFPTGISYACVTAGGTGGVTGPTSAVTVEFIIA